jgi:hypothetical protein
MPRATKDAVIEVVEWQDGTISEEPAISLTPFIRQANILVDWLHSKDTDNELNDTALTAIEVQLAAHFYSVQRDPQLQSKSTDGASGSYQGATGFSLQATHYGQNAMLLDVTGNLTKRNIEAQQGKRVSVTTWLGWQDHSEDPYDA